MFRTLPGETNHSLTHSFTYSLTHSFIHSIAHSLTHSITHSLIYSLNHSLIDSLIRLFIHCFLKIHLIYYYHFFSISQDHHCFTKTDCYHYFHCHCLLRYIKYHLNKNDENTEDKEKQVCAFNVPQNIYDKFATTFNWKNWQIGQTFSSINYVVFYTRAKKIWCHLYSWEAKQL